MERRTVHDVIGQAISENEFAARILYSLCAVIVLTGLFGIVFGVGHSEPVYACVGSIPSVVLWPAFRFASNLRKQNISIRLLELAIDGKTPPEASKVLREFFVASFKRQDEANPTGLPSPGSALGVPGK